MIDSAVKIGIATRCLGHSLPKALHVVAQMGAHGVGIDARTELRPDEMSRTATREIRRRLDDARLQVASVSFWTRGGLADPSRGEERVLAMRSAMQLAYGLGCRTLLTNPGPLPNPDQERPWQQLQESIHAVAGFAQHEGVHVALRTSNAGSQPLAEVIDAASEACVGVDLYPASLVAAGETAHESLAVLARHVIHVTACDAVRDFSTGSNLEVDLGRGMTDWPAVFAFLAERDYDGWVTVERGDANADTVRQAVQFLSRVFD